MKRFAMATMIGFLAVCGALAQDPVQLAPEHYKVLVDNAQVRVLRATRGGHEKAPMHSHPDYVTIYLTDLNQKITLPDGTVQEVHRKAGTTSFSKALTHAEDNISDEPLEVVVVELKPGAPHGAGPVPPELDPAKIDGKYHTVDFENDRVRVLRTVLEPHIKSPMHAHPGYVVVYLANMHTKMTFPDGTVNDNRRKKGDVAWRDALKHTTENVEDTHAEEIQVELK
jgi:quercetin dioxygenase-like cupin family protein